MPESFHFVVICRFIAVAALSSVLSSGCSTQSGATTKDREERARSVSVTAVRRDSVPRSMEVVGTLAAEDQVTISSQADGAVSRVLVDLGDRVKAGDVLLELDREKLEYNLQNQKASLARALAKYGATEPGKLPPIDQTPDVQRTAAELAQAKQAFERAQALYGRQLIPSQTLDDAQSTLQTRQATYDSALQNAKNLAADVDASSAMLKLADRQLRDTSIRAPFDGFVQKRLVSLGEFVRSEAPVMSLVRVDTLKVIAEIPERMAPWIELGQPVDLSVDAFPGKTLSGKVSRISPAVNTPTRAFSFEALVPNKDGLLKPGTFTRVHLTTALIESVLTIPYAAMQYRYGVYRAFGVAGDRLVLHELKTGDRVGERMEILDGVKEGELIALTDVDNLTDGLKVVVNRDGE